MSELVDVLSYTEILSIPFRLTRQRSDQEPCTDDEMTLKFMADWLSSSNQRGKWERVLDASIPAVSLAGEPLPDAWSAAQHYQAYAYLHPTVRSFLFGASSFFGEGKGEFNDYLQLYRRKDFESIEVVAGGGGGRAEGWPLAFKVVRHDLFLMQPDVCILQLELCAIIEEGKPLPLYALQKVRDELRRLFPPYFGGAERETPQFAGHFLSKVTLKPRGADPNSPFEHSNTSWPKAVINETFSSSSTGNRVPRHSETTKVVQFWADLLPEFESYGTGRGPWPIFSGDDRAPSMAFIAVNDPRQISEGDWVRLTYADAPGEDTLPYARPFLEQMGGEHRYDRFWHAPTDSSDSPSRILNCGYAFTMVGAHSDRFFFTDSRAGAIVSFRQIYSRMALVAHFQKTALLGATARLSALSWRNSNTGRLDDYTVRARAIQSFYEHFVEFTHVFWFDEVSPQEQGVQLFDMWQRSLRSRELYGEVRQEVKDLVDYVNLKENKRQSDRALNLTWVVGVLGALGVVAGLLGVNLLQQSGPTGEGASSKLYVVGLGDYVQVTHLIFWALGLILVTMVAGVLTKYLAGSIVRGWRRISRR